MDAIERLFSFLVSSFLRLVLHRMLTSATVSAAIFVLRRCVILTLADRNYNANNLVLQEPYLWESVIIATKKAMQIRYSLLPYMYTLFHEAHTRGSTVMRALAWEFPSNPAVATADRQFLLGPSLLISPALEQGADSVQAVFPGVQQGTIWYDWYNQSRIVDSKALRGENVSIPAPLGHIPVFVRGGSVLPMQPLQDALTTRQARRQPWGLLVALDACDAAKGSLYLDDGESVSPPATLKVNMTVASGTMHVKSEGLFEEKVALSNVTVMGVKRPVSAVRFNGCNVGGFRYDGKKETLEVVGLGDLTKRGAWNQDWTLSWK